jgi:hypothetical protein
VVVDLERFDRRVREKAAAGRAAAAAKPA